MPFRYVPRRVTLRRSSNAHKLMHSGVCRICLKESRFSRKCWLSRAGTCRRQLSEGLRLAPGTAWKLDSAYAEKDGRNSQPSRPRHTLPFNFGGNSLMVSAVPVVFGKLQAKGVRIANQFSASYSFFDDRILRRGCTRDCFRLMKGPTALEQPKTDMTGENSIS